MGTYVNISNLRSKNDIGKALLTNKLLVYPIFTLFKATFARRCFQIINRVCNQNNGVINCS